MTTDPNAPANPAITSTRDHTGLTKREHIATEILKGLVTTNQIIHGPDSLAEGAVNIADALIKRLNK